MKVKSKFKYYVKAVFYIIKHERKFKYRNIISSQLKIYSKTWIFYESRKVYLRHSKSVSIILKSQLEMHLHISFYFKYIPRPQNILSYSLTLFCLVKFTNFTSLSALYSYQGSIWRGIPEGQVTFQFWKSQLGRFSKTFWLNVLLQCY